AGLSACPRREAAQDGGARFKRRTTPSSASGPCGGCPARRHIFVSGVRVKRASFSWQGAHPSRCRARLSRSAAVKASAKRPASVSSEGQEGKRLLRGRWGGRRTPLCAGLERAVAASQRRATAAA